jgi:hypothetical protein
MQLKTPGMKVMVAILTKKAMKSCFTAMIA